MKKSIATAINCSSDCLVFQTRVVPQHEAAKSVSGDFSLGAQGVGPEFRGEV